MALLLQVTKWLKKISMWGAVIVFCCVGLSVFAQIVFRYCFSIALNWVDEFARYGLVWFTFLGGAAGLDAIETTSVTFIRDKIPEKYYRWIRLIFDICIDILVFYLIKTGFTFAELGKKTKTLALWGLTQYIPFLAIPVGSIIIFFSCMVRTVTAFLGIQEPEFDEESKGEESE